MTPERRNLVEIKAKRLQMNELTFLEHFAPKFDIPVPEHLTADASRSEIREALLRWGGAIVKPDILAGKRGKGGFIWEVEDVREAMRKLKLAAAAEINGKIARTAYMVQRIPAVQEIYTAITYDSRFLSPSFTLSLEGGMDVEEIGEDRKKTLPIDVFKGLDAYQASGLLEELGCPGQYVSLLARTFVKFWDLFISTGMRMAEVNPWRVTPEGEVYACDFKGIFDDANYKYGDAEAVLPEYPEGRTEFEEEMAEWSAASHQGQAHVAELGGKKVLPILFGGGASTIIIETLEEYGGDPIFLSDFGGNPPYARMYGTAERCFRYKLKDASLLLILGGKANNTLIDVTFQAIADALRDYVACNGPIHMPVIVGRGGPRLVQGLLAMQRTLEELRLPYVIFGPDTPLTLVAEYAAKVASTLEDTR
ncbi:MAG TPA: ATP citrate lyase citrate-binding domain-containing protein [Phycisphaerae bacterium]|jgi:succinyl-CoA synthetase beta subunit|nr:ATP citrate lyase citrate-binding domain-containing protein [Phycisphaerae bacterium]HOJ53808.1 ATP citrate lyase citrate-binding domain-containing protein [Phycisphaerae bacterium]HOL26139.1 ATP citrate lyase citrate-binding domain-containing protein [Phycisphaerae bacterium]HPP20126.1 ATP citrate lyase citrate-binding domain-containing protein [Phycisphaerae bacterium]HPU34064.1 ATP citrate lyase citrate-binding domain-containing protein [Phycisphaerae bacterium]